MKGHDRLSRVYCTESGGSFYQHNRKLLQELKAVLFAYASKLQIAGANNINFMARTSKPDSRTFIWLPVSPLFPSACPHTCCPREVRSVSLGRARVDHASIVSRLEQMYNGTMYGQREATEATAPFSAMLRQKIQELGLRPSQRDIGDEEYSIPLSRIAVSSVDNFWRSVKATVGRSAPMSAASVHIDKDGNFDISDDVETFRLPFNLKGTVIILPRVVSQVTQD